MIQSIHMEKELESIKQEIGELKVILKENHDMILGIHRRARITMLFGAVKWAIIVGISIGAFYYIQPFLETLMKTYASISGLGGAGSIPDQQSILEILNNFK